MCGPRGEGRVWHWHTIFGSRPSKRLAHLAQPLGLAQGTAGGRRRTCKSENNGRMFVIHKCRVRGYGIGTSGGLVALHVIFGSLVHMGGGGATRGTWSSDPRTPPLVGGAMYQTRAVHDLRPNRPTIRKKFLTPPPRQKKWPAYRGVEGSKAKNFIGGSFGIPE